MALAAEIQSWVEEMKAAGVSEAVISALTNEAEKNEKVGNALKGSVSATSDYKKKMDLLRKQEKDAQDLASAHTAAMEELTRWKQNEVDPTLAKANAISTEMATLKTRISERAKLLKEKYGIDDAEVADLLDTTKAVVREVAKEVNATVTDDGKFVKSEDFNKVVRAQSYVDARIQKFGRQFDKLFANTDKEFDPEALLDLAGKENITLEKAFEKLYDIPARRTELASQAKEKEFADRLAKERAQWEAQRGTTGPGTTRPGEEGAYLTDVLNRHKGKEGDGGSKTADVANPMDRIRQAARPTAPAEAVNRYVSSYRNQKFKEKGIPVEAGA
jgi:hypothetical protein